MKKGGSHTKFDANLVDLLLPLSLHCLGEHERQSAFEHLELTAPVGF